MSYVEKCLFEYNANIAALEVLQSEINNLKSIHVQSYQEINSSNSNSDPVLNTVSQAMELEKKIARLEKKIKPINKLIMDLSSGKSLYIRQLRDILTLKYIGHEDNHYIQEEMCVSVSTYWRRVRELLRIARKYFGNVE